MCFKSQFSVSLGILKKASNARINEKRAEYEYEMKRKTEAIFSNILNDIFSDSHKTFVEHNMFFFFSFFSTAKSISFFFFFFFVGMDPRNMHSQCLYHDGSL